MTVVASIENPVLLIEKIFADAVVPTRAHETDSGLDLYAHSFKNWDGIVYSTDCVSLDNGDRLLVGTGVKATVGPGYEIQIRPRSGLALKQGLTVLNAPGTVDEQYRGEISVIIVNHSRSIKKITKGDRIAQMVVCPVILLEPTLVEKLPSTERDAGGFGSSGV